MTDAEKEYRAQWIRDAARDFMTAHLSVGAETRPTIYYQAPQPYPESWFDPGSIQKVPDGAPLPVTVDPFAGVVARLYSLASSLWDLYVKERE